MDVIVDLPIRLPIGADRKLMSEIMFTRLAKAL